MSPDERASLAELARLRGEIEADRAALDRAVDDANTVMQRWPTHEAPERPYLLMGAVALHAWYTGLEALIERVARQLDHSVPEGASWHRALLVQAMVEVPGVRPAIVERALLPELTEMLGFRHFFRHAYGIEIDPTRLRALLERLLAVAPRVTATLEALDSFLDAAAIGLRES